MIIPLYLNKTYESNLNKEIIFERLNQKILNKSVKNIQDSELTNDEKEFKYEGKITPPYFNFKKRFHLRSFFNAKAYGKIESNSDKTLINLLIRPADYGITMFIFCAFLFFISFNYQAWLFLFFVILMLIIGIIDFMIIAKELEQFINVELLENKLLQDK